LWLFRGATKHNSGEGAWVAEVHDFGFAAQVDVRGHGPISLRHQLF
jgi:hypothetical protein